ncbi:hypothetical protein LZ198_10340 [Myxococcus sp. K15C18031901]|uniref:hypothetical protein n=1 Tax=Myxococcus dinghuensis TaxID=2906761 RepID=UPI0020A760DC|nr:hypothetical protein [Myxococcus dinghuensis]MCP3099269.1 hypothetical protein [Myxococcus dinghuensis]
MSLQLATLPLLLSLGQAPELPKDDPRVQARLSFLARDPEVGTQDSFTQWHAALEARSPELTTGLRAEAALSFFVDTEGGTSAVRIVDNASALRLRYQPSSWGAGEGLTLSVFPLSASRIHMGYAYPVSWSRKSFLSPVDGEPGVELRLKRSRWSAFAAVKSAELSFESNLDLRWQRRYLGFVGGAFDATPELRVEAKGTLGKRGVLSLPFNDDREIPSRGASARLFWHRGAPVGNTVDLSLYAGDPTFYERFFTPDVAATDFAASVSLEGSLQSQDLQDPHSLAPKSVTETAHAAALDARLRVGRLRLNVLGTYRSFAFVRLETPGLSPFYSTPAEDEPRAELTGSIGVDYHFARTGLTPGLLVRGSLPAFARLSDPYSGNRPLVILEPGRLFALPSGADRSLMTTVKATLRWDLLDVAGVLAEFTYLRNPNRTEFMSDDNGVAVPVHVDPDSFGGTVMLQVRL